MEACELLGLELRLDRIEAEIAGELPPHLRQFARAYAAGAHPPRAPEVLLRPTTLETARATLAHPVLADRGLALLRLAGPAAIEADAAVVAARAAESTWPALAVLAAARDASAMARFGRAAIDVLHRLHGSAAAEAISAARSNGSRPTVARSIDGSRNGDDRGLPPVVAGWFDPDGIAVDARAIADAWQAIRARHGVDGAVRFERAAGARPRTFVVEPGREIIVVIPERVAAPAERFAVLHELGHAVAALALPAGIPRVLDEAAAAYVAAAIERDGDPWYSPLAVAARARRCALARALDRIERGLPELPAEPRLSERPPWALWHDAGAQAAYVAAEAIAEALAGTLGASPAPGALAAALATWRAEIDRLGAGTCAP